MACGAGFRRWWDGRTGVDEMVDGRIVIVFRRNLFVNSPSPPPFLESRNIQITNPPFSRI